VYKTAVYTLVNDVITMMWLPTPSLRRQLCSGVTSSSSRTTG